jgi:hypothetical protein
MPPTTFTRAAYTQLLRAVGAGLVSIHVTDFTVVVVNLIYSFFFHIYGRIEHLGLNFRMNLRFQSVLILSRFCVAVIVARLLVKNRL